MKPLRFKGELYIFGINPYILVSKERAEKLKKDWRKPMPVTVQINGQPNPAWHINMMPIGDGSFYLYLSGEVRKASQTKVGDIVEVSVAYDPDYQRGPTHPVPSAFQHALDTDAKVKENWEKLTPSRQKEILRYFSSLKSEEALERNITKALHVLSGNDGRFMARSWKNGN